MILIKCLFDVIPQKIGEQDNWQNEQGNWQNGTSSICKSRKGLK